MHQRRSVARIVTNNAATAGELPADHPLDFFGTIPSMRSGRNENGNVIRPSTGHFQRKGFQHGVGGARTPFIDVPDATYFTNSPGPGTCREMGHKTPYDAAKMMEVYGSRKNYAAKFAEAVDRLVKERWLTEGDGKRLKQAVSANSGN